MIVSSTFIHSTRLLNYYLYLLITGNNCVQFLFSVVNCAIDYKSFVGCWIELDKKIAHRSRRTTGFKFLLVEYQECYDDMK